MTGWLLAGSWLAPGSIRHGRWSWHLIWPHPWAPTGLLGRQCGLSPHAGFFSQEIDFLLPRLLPCPEMTSSGHCPQNRMTGSETIYLLRFFVQRSDKWQDWPQAEGILCETLLLPARETQFGGCDHDGEVGRADLLFYYEATSFGL